jgi:colanic acid biosynthesis protein WcaH
MQLPEQEFKKIVENAPLVSIDLIVERNRKYAFGRRLNPPAKGMLFVPGGRIHKDQTIEDTFRLLTQRELGIACDIANAVFLGMYEHFYSDSVVGDSVTTHYVVLAYLIRLGPEIEIDLSDQHAETYWLNQEDIRGEKDVHKYSLAYFPPERTFMSNSDLHEHHESLVVQLKEYNTIIWVFPTAYLGGLAFAVDKLAGRYGVSIAVGLVALALLYAFWRHIVNQRSIIRAIRNVESALYMKCGSFYMPHFKPAPIPATYVVLCALVVSTMIVWCILLFETEAFSACSASLVAGFLMVLLCISDEKEEM